MAAGHGHFVELRLRRYLLLLIATALIALVVFGNVQGQSRLSQALQNAAHAPAFCILALIFMQMRRGSPSYLQTFMFCAVLGVGIEGVQALIGRDASGEDALADSLGALAGLAAYASTKTQKMSVPLRIACLTSLGIATAPLAWCITAYINREARFPTIAEFHSPLDLYFFKSQKPEFQIRGDSALLVPLPTGPWPGITLEEPAPNWEGYGFLVTDVANPNDATLSLTIRVHDRAHNQEQDDRYNQSFDLPPRARKQLRIPLAAIRNAPQARSMDMTRIAGLIIFGKPDVAGYSLVLNRIALE
jgi:hypothetical protein